MRPRILVTTNLPVVVYDPLIAADVEPEGGCNDEALSHDQLLHDVAGMSGVVVTVDDEVGADVFDAAGDNLAVVSIHSADVSHIDVAEATRRGIVVTIVDPEGPCKGELEGDEKTAWQAGQNAVLVLENKKPIASVNWEEARAHERWQ